jgi:nitroreductase/NAD-dependent dihydropyrimidine dehydrogenase PreA subunit
MNRSAQLWTPSEENKRRGEEVSKISVEREKCTLCEACIETCPTHNFFMENSEVRVAHEEECIACGHCVSVCPADAVTHEGLDLTDFLPAPQNLPLSPEAIYSFLRLRRSCRAYETKEVPRGILEKLIEIARFAPTGHNRQNFEFIIVQDKGKIEKLSQMAARFYGDLWKELEASPEPSYLKTMMYDFRMNYEFSLQGKDRIFRGAPVVILVHAPAGVFSSLDNCLYAIFHIVMMAQSLGLGTCINRYFVNAADRVPEIPKELGVPAGDKIFGCVTVGFPKHNFYKLPSRKPAKGKWV